MQFKTRFNSRSETDGMTYVKPSLTLQSEYASTTVDFYLKRYASTGILGNPDRAVQAQFGDFSSLQDYQQSQNLIAKTRQTFEALPSSIRAQFEHNVDRYVEFLSNPDNREKAIAMGLLFAEKVVEPSVDPALTPSVPSVSTGSVDPVETSQSEPAQFSS